MRTTHRSVWKEVVIAGNLMILSMTAIASLQWPKLSQLKSAQVERSSSQLQREVAQEAISLKLLQHLPNFGFDNLVADWAYIKFLIYFGDDPAREQTSYELTPQYFEIALNEDRRFIPAYFGMSSSVSLYLGRPELSVEMMQKGLQSLSAKDPHRAYYIWRYLGTDQLLFLGDGEAARDSFAKAAEWASKYSDLESQNLATLSTLTANFLAQNPDSTQAQFQAWQIVLLNAVDDKTRWRAIANMEALGGRVILDSQGKIETLIPPSDP